MTRCLPCFLCVLCLLAGCKKAGENKIAVREGVVEHLSKNAALDVNSLTIDVTDVKFQGDEATAAVAIKPKTAPDQVMTMSYTLVRKGEKWEVKGKAAGHGGGMGGSMGGAATIPETGPGHGSSPEASPGPSTGATPEPKGALGDAPKTGDLPPGHPPVNSPPSSKK